ncbi:helix-turn-helix domain-containing protein [Paenibacillus algorifonticola]|uniref:helix-turn-helix domain-containing protein n=1 Tax=Paenibacillus algorifonticola TaxID=684063 RepID=UPI003D2E7D61
MTVGQLMKFLNIGQNNAYQLLRDGEIDHFLIGTRNKRIKKKAIIEWINRQ